MFDLPWHVGQPWVWAAVFAGAGALMLALRRYAHTRVVQGIFEVWWTMRSFRLANFDDRDAPIGIMRGRLLVVAILLLLPALFFAAVGSGVIRNGIGVG